MLKHYTTYNDNGINIYFFIKKYKRELSIFFYTHFEQISIFKHKTGNKESENGYYDNTPSVINRTRIYSYNLFIIAVEKCRERLSHALSFISKSFCNSRTNSSRSGIAQSISSRRNGLRKQTFDAG